MKKEINTSIRINASAEKVWRVLNSFEQYQEWNPFIKTIEGAFEPKSKIKVVLAMNESKKMTFKPIVQEFSMASYSMAWLGNLMLPGIFDGHHIFKIEKHNDKSCTFYHEEKFKGILVRFLASKIDGEFTENFKKMNEALKKRAENL